MTGALAVGVLVGAGIILLATGLAAAPAPLAAELAALHRRPPVGSRSPAGRPGGPA